MSVHIRGILPLGEEAESSDDTSWDDEDASDLTDQDCEIMASIGWEPDDLDSYADQDRYRRYLTKKQ